MNTVSLTLTTEQIHKLAQAYPQAQVSQVPYAHYRLKIPNLTITAYQSGKVVFQGKLAEEHAKAWQTGPVNRSQKSANQANKLPGNLNATSILIGSDEVGNGSYFGALTVAAVYLNRQQLQRAKAIGVKDSKHLTDGQIIKISQILQDEVKYSLICCNPEEYNQLIGRYNAVSLKVHLHNQVIKQLINKLNSSEKNQLEGILIDQFTSARNFYQYLQKEETPLQQGLHFIERAESVHLSVASASIIARAAFLQSLTDLGHPYQLTLPSGAGSKVDDFGRKLVAQWGPEVLHHTAKLHFKNTEKILIN